ncbi:MAG: thioredoxin [Sphaerochaeta sp.]|jgi:thioredoxin 1|uniref:thioredoxin n=1 Tax=Sphaerochaeta sp. S2 TaxID=2798868 RepID=UPI0018E9E4EB|nr:thioredoxin [Sphaerochaeta sp. S2]MCK9348978.1 thioredoxin [Sphaerochaeta sp.]MBJ2356716.1 thioredoxin [Sphaerochaeta sp. S2]MDD4302173.1 thioredoxin [Sphaerochaeta sp.]MDD4647282.1 thioredoxin [Sphaerochaeta sp.]MDY0244171.1 thioredoxin [Sphaerochaeta sp.]
MVKNVTKSTYEAEVLKSDVPVVVDFWAPWCGPCRMQGPILDQLDKEMDGKMKVVKVNVDEEGELAMTFGVQSIPTLLFYKDGKVVDKAIGVRDATAVKKALSL